MIPKPEPVGTAQEQDRELSRTYKARLAREEETLREQSSRALAIQRFLTAQNRQLAEDGSRGDIQTEPEVVVIPETPTTPPFNRAVQSVSAWFPWLPKTPEERRQLQKIIEANRRPDLHVNDAEDSQESCSGSQAERLAELERAYLAAVERITAGEATEAPQVTPPHVSTSGKCYDPNNKYPQWKRGEDSDSD